MTKYQYPIEKSNVESWDGNDTSLMEVASVYERVADDPLNLDYLLEFMGLAQDRNSTFPKELLHFACSLTIHTPDQLLKLADCLKKAGENERALALYVKAAEREDLSLDAFCEIAHFFVDIGEIDLGLSCLEKASQLDQEHPKFVQTVPSILYKVGRFEECIRWIHDHFSSISKRDRSMILGRALSTSPHTHDEGVALLKQYLFEHPDDLDVHLFLTGALLRRPGYNEQCKHICYQGLKVFPTSSYLHFHFAWVLLSSGEWDLGWREYEWRWKTGQGKYLERFLAPPRFPEWDGSKENAGGTILVHSEQGVGDNFMFSLFIKDLYQHFDRVILATYKELIDVFNKFAIVDQVVDLKGHLPFFEQHVSIGSLPLVLGQTDPHILNFKYTYSANALGNLPQLPVIDKKRVGFVWGGSTLSPDDNRSIPGEIVEAFIDETDEFLFYILQQGLKNFSVGDLSKFQGKLVDCRPFNSTWTQTAEILLTLDYLITVDTGIAHLAGLLGVSTAIILPWDPDWRWFDSKLLPEFTQKCVWYPKTRLFRCSDNDDFLVHLRAIKQWILNQE